MVHFRRFLVACVGVLGPFVIEPQRLLHPSPWLAWLAAVVLQVTLPVDTATKPTHSGEDGGSAWLILITGNAVALAPIIEFVLRGVVAPPPGSLWVVLGAVALASGTFLRVWAIRVLGTAFTGMVRTEADQPLLRAGPYRWLRHPSYSGMLLAFLGQAAMFQSWAGLGLTVGAMIPVYLYRIRKEETALSRHFGERYVAYRAESWALVPFLF